MLIMFELTKRWLIDFIVTLLILVKYIVKIILSLLNKVYLPSHHIKILTVAKRAKRIFNDDITIIITVLMYVSFIIVNKLHNYSEITVKSCTSPVPLYVFRYLYQNHTA